jgi:hypothetical protein
MAERPASAAERALDGRLLVELIKYHVLSGRSVILVSHDRHPNRRIARACCYRGRCARAPRGVQHDLRALGRARPRARGALLVINGAMVTLQPEARKTLAVAAVRMVLQLALIGLILKFISQTSPRLTVPQGSSWCSLPASSGVAAAPAGEGWQA